MGNCKEIKFGIIALHPIQYQDKLWELLYFQAKCCNIDLNIIFLDKLGIQEIQEKDWNSSLEFSDVLQLNYPHKFLKNFSPFKLNPFFGRVNPGLIHEIAKYDVILVHGYTQFSMLFAVVLAKLFGKKVIYRGESLPFQINSLKGKIKRKILKNFFRLTDMVLFSCSGNRKFFELCEVNKEKLLLIPCAVDNEFFRNKYFKYQKQILKIRKELGINEKDIVVTSVARLVNVKRPYDIIKAINLLKNKNSHIKMLFVGDGPLRGYLTELSKSFGLEKNLIITGFKKQSEIGQFYAISDIFVLPSSKDPSPKALNEALNFELPAIITEACGTAGDLVKHGYNGYIIKVGDIEKLAEHIYDLAVNHEKRKLFGKRSWEIVKDWNFEKDAEAIIEAVKRVL